MHMNFFLPQKIFPPPSLTWKNKLLCFHRWKKNLRNSDHPRKTFFPPVLKSLTQERKQFRLALYHQKKTVNCKLTNIICFLFLLWTVAQFQVTTLTCSLTQLLRLIASEMFSPHSQRASHLSAQQVTKKPIKDKQRGNDTGLEDRRRASKQCCPTSAPVLKEKRKEEAGGVDRERLCCLKQVHTYMAKWNALLWYGEVFECCLSQVTSNK